MRFRFWPIVFYRKEIDQLAKEIFDLIGGRSIDFIEREFDKVMAYKRLQIYEALFKAIQIELAMRPKIVAMKMMLEKDYAESPQLEIALSEVKKYTGIEIKMPDDIILFRDWVNHKIAKYHELYPTQEVQEGVNLNKVIYSVFNFMGEPYRDEMPLLMFIEMKEMAEERIKSQKTTQDGE
jgi:hypothetical protein